MNRPTVFNLQHGTMAFVNVGFTIFIINLFGGPLYMAVQVGILQGILSFCIVGINTQFFHMLFRKTKIWMSILLPSLFTTSLSFTLHTINNSTQPILSAFAVFIMAVVHFSVLAKLVHKFDTLDLFKLGKHCVAWIVKK